jgi:hypothetical protein
MTTDNHKKYEAAAKAHFDAIGRPDDGNEMRAWIAGASFVRTELEEKAEEFYSFGFKDGENKSDVVINDLQDKLLERQKEYKLAIETAAILKEQRDEAIDKLEAAEKEAHNVAIDKALTTMKIEWREDRHEIYNAIEKLKL